jgi:hypothetical protein
MLAWIAYFSPSNSTNVTPLILRYRYTSQVQHQLSCFYSPLYTDVWNRSLNHVVLYRLRKCLLYLTKHVSVNMSRLVVLCCTLPLYLINTSNHILKVMSTYNYIYISWNIQKEIHLHHHHHHKHPGLGHLARSVSRVTVALSIVSSVSQLFSFGAGCSEMILKGFGFVAFFAGVKASSFCIHLSCLVYCLSVVRGEWSRLFCGHNGRNLPEVSITSFLPPAAEGN